jgi:hypothetical protein
MTNVWKTVEEIGVDVLRAELKRLADLGIMPFRLCCFAEADGLKEQAAEVREEMKKDGDDDGAAEWDEYEELQSTREAEEGDPHEFVGNYFDEVEAALDAIKYHDGMAAAAAQVRSSLAEPYA